MHRRVSFALVCLIAGPVVTLAAGDAGIEFFEKKIRPVLVEHCTTCHSSDPKKQKGQLALDSREGVRKGGESGHAVVPGKPNDSLLMKAVRYTDPDFKMPPKGKLPAEVIADLERWIAMGAPDPRTGAPVTVAQKWNSLEEGRKFWAYQPPRKHALPDVKTADWARRPIDRFILGRLESQGLRPSGDADRVTLLRRATFALNGVPPTPGEIDAFLADRTPEAWARVIDRLLASPHFGERWGRHWLDVARYAESSGGGRSLLFKEAWRYRDYVIRAFNNDTPYNRFILEQIAGDLLPYATPEERRELLIATAFLLLGPHNYELQDKPTLEMDIADEQVDTMGKAFLGMTIGCARCHDHKFDPIPTKDYYALVGIMRSTNVIIHENVSRWVEQPLPMRPELARRVAEHDKAVAALKQQIALVKAAEKKAGKDVDAVLTQGPLVAAELPGIVIDDTQAKKVGSWKHSVFSGNYIGKGYLYDDRGMKGEKTVTFVPDFEKTGFYEVRLAYVPHTNRASNVPVRIFHADGDVTVNVNQRQTPPIEGRWVSLGRHRFEQGMQWFVMVSTDGANGHVVADAVQFLADDVIVERKIAPAPIAPKGKETPRDSKALEAELKRLLAEAPNRPMAMAVSDAEKIEDCHIRIRGNTHNKGELAPRGVLQILTPAGKTPPIPANESGRRQLAEWLAAPDNPLTARVMVNRVWHHLFGAGLVRTVDNFGATGETPSHPELLDYLALRFIEEGWSVKKLIREIMLSRVYQQSSELGVRNSELQSKSTPNSELRTPNSVDPENRLWWRMNRRRLDAEALRDSILVVSGQLDRTVGGATMKKETTVERDYRFDDVRRSVYTPIFRNKLLELFEVFDFADPNISMGRRNVSTVATQALYFMNSPFVMDQSRAAAKALLAQPNLDDKVRVEQAYRVTLGRPPTERERQLALNFVGAATAEERLAAWERFYQTLFACIDFRYVN